MPVNKKPPAVGQTSATEKLDNVTQTALEQKITICEKVKVDLLNKEASIVSARKEPLNHEATDIIERHINLMDEKIIKPGIIAKKSSIDLEKIYYFKQIVAPGTTPRLPLGDLLKDMIMQAGICQGLDMIRKIPYKKFALNNSLKKSANNRMMSYLRQKAGLSETAAPRLSNIFQQLNNRVVIPKMVAFMGTGFGKLLLKFLRK